MKVFPTTGQMIEFIARERHEANLISGDCFTDNPDELIDKYSEKGHKLELIKVEGENNLYRYSCLIDEINILKKKLICDGQDMKYYIHDLKKETYAIVHNFASLTST